MIFNSDTFSDQWVTFGVRITKVQDCLSFGKEINSGDFTVSFVNISTYMVTNDSKQPKFLPFQIVNQ
jgi:hypothetical protein